MTNAAEPIRPAELAGLFDQYLKSLADARAALAVSGGSDSTALMVLCADWLGQIGAPTAGLTVLTVDHGLRPQSAEEARLVAHRAADLGFAHATLVWEGAKPQTGLQAAARAARYRLMGAYVHHHGLGWLLTAHTAEDQAETVLMRLARGSGLDGLAGMSQTTVLGARGEQPLRIVRPLLNVSRARLRATLTERGIPWVEDPSNLSPAFERTRLRAAREHLDALGLTSEMICLSARRLQRARAAVDGWAASFADAAAGHVHVDPCGYLAIDGPALRALPAEIAIRVLTRAVVAAGGSDEPVALANVETIAGHLGSGSGCGAWTLSRAKITAGPEHILIEREPGREELPHLTLAPGRSAVWDGRFKVHAEPAMEGTVDVGPLGPDGLKELRGLGAVTSPAPASTLRAMPAFRRGGVLVAVPSLNWFGAPRVRGRLAAHFPALGWYNSAAAAARADEPFVP
ncbi:MAG: tRNA lysidine(34) synthetase TilS [Hyphomicrobiaceae bacterium]|nr:MAG: tRNA lysidine(34) synthetase TilS [Hyphomicrobiaceae bacterium]